MLSESDLKKSVNNFGIDLVNIFDFKLENELTPSSISQEFSFELLLLMHQFENNGIHPPALPPRKNDSSKTKSAGNTFNDPSKLSSSCIIVEKSDEFEKNLEDDELLPTLDLESISFSISESIEVKTSALQ